MSGKPTLYVFLISHYCEKARWALDAAGLDYKLRPIAPGFHRKQAKKLGLKAGALPYLETQNGVVQGSADIIDWVDGHSQNQFTPLEVADEARAIEKRLDDKIGIHTRRYYYSEAMVEYPHTVRPIFVKSLPFVEKFVVKQKWDMIRSLMIKGMDLGPQQGLESKAIIETELDWLDGLLADGRTYLAGGQFSRADIAAASLLAPLAIPAEHPEYTNLAVPPGVQTDIELWTKRPCMKYVHNMYAKHRKAP